MIESITTYDAAVSYLNDTPRFTEKHTLEQTKKYLQYLGSPERAFRVIHVAGTNGKGSVCAALSEVLRCAGYSVGLFTSPHLVTTRERMVVNGEMISEQAFLEDFQEIRAMLRFRHRDFPHPTYFEYLFLMAMVRFRKAGVDAAVLETGLGGRLDATNAVAHPDVTVITSISLDHTQYLGDTIRLIAAEKAGIIKPGVPVIYDGSDPAAAEVISARAREACAPEYPVLPERILGLRRQGKGIAFTLPGRYDLFHLQIPYPAEYQAMNAALAACAAECFLTRSDSDDEGGPAIAGSADGMAVLTRRMSIETGISRSCIPGRMEEKSGGIILDGAHNPAGMDAFLRAVRSMAGPGQVLLLGILKDKDFERMVRQIGRSGLWDEVIVTGMDIPRALPPEDLASILTECSQARVFCAADPTEALRRAQEVRGGRRYLFAAGSLYLIGMLEELL